MKRCLVILFCLFSISNISSAQSRSTTDLECPIIYQTLSFGMADSITKPKGQVTSLQQFLKDYYGSTVFKVDGKYRKPTVTMVKLFQKEHKLPQTGMVKLDTRRKIFTKCYYDNGQITAQQKAQITQSSTGQLNQSGNTQQIRTTNFNVGGIQQQDSSQQTRTTNLQQSLQGTTTSGVCIIGISTLGTCTIQ